MNMTQKFYDVSSVAKYLMSFSPLHKDMTDDDFNRRIVPPINNGRFIFWIDKDEMPFAFATWTYLSDEAVRGFISQTRLTHPEDFETECGELHVMMFVAPFGGVHRLVKEAASIFEEITDEQCLHLWRNYADGRPRRMGFYRRRKNVFNVIE